VWLHASPRFIRSGDWVVPPSESGIPPHWTADEATLRRAQDLNYYSPDRVCIFDSEGAPAIDHIDRFSFITNSSYIYEVEPEEPLEADPDPSAPLSWRRCKRARILSCKHRPSSI
jgi:hypothetical protein